MPTKTSQAIGMASEPSVDQHLSCFLCPCKGSSVDELAQHIESVHRRYLCLTCPTILKKPKYLQRHVLKCSGRKQSPASQAIPKVLETADPKKGRKPRPADPMDTVCRFCKATFKARRSMLRHIRSFHRNPSSLPTNKVSPTLDADSKNEIMDSKENRGTTQGTVDDTTCRFCKNTFKTRVYLARHVEKFHLKSTSFVSTQVPSVDANLVNDNMGSTQKRKKLPVDPMNAVCRFCNATFKQRSYMMRHVRKFHRKSSRLPTTTTRVSPMDEDPERRSDVDPSENRKELKHAYSNLSNGQPAFKVFASCEKRHKCYICGEKYFQEKHLRRHMSMFHEGGHNCPNCSQWFRLQVNFKKHLDACTSSDDNQENTLLPKNLK